MTDDLWRLDATELARLIRLGRVSSREAAQSCLSRLRAVNPAINAVVRVLEEEALAAADAADAAQSRGDALGALHGVPITVKVNTDQAGCPTDNGVVAFRDAIAPRTLRSLPTSSRPARSLSGGPTPQLSRCAFSRTTRCTDGR
jgi:Asp-tRNA(Asn)/Glu-tRNA(Gln) amidotransferase A subunit family amidase